MKTTCARPLICARRLQAVHAGHLDVEEHDLWPVRGEQLDRGLAVRRFADEIELGPERGQGLAQLRAQQRFVVGEQCGGTGGGVHQRACCVK